MNKSELLSIAKPILFNTSEVQATLDGNKTAKRLIVKERALNNFNFDSTGKLLGSFDGIDMYPSTDDAPYHISDICYVRETWNICNLDIEDNTITFVYKASEPETEEGAMTVKVSDEIYDKYDYSMAENNPDWRPSIHMPKEAARIFLRVTDVRVERLQDIQIKDISKEGLDNTVPSDTSGEICSYCSLPAEYQGVHCYGEEVVMCGDSPRCEEALHKWEDEYTEEFTELWNGTVKKSDLDKYGWDANPWVWVIEFERLEVSE